MIACAAILARQTPLDNRTATRFWDQHRHNFNSTNNKKRPLVFQCILCEPAPKRNCASACGCLIVKPPKRSTEDKSTESTGCHMAGVVQRRAAQATSFEPREMSPFRLSSTVLRFQNGKKNAKNAQKNRTRCWAALRSSFRCALGCVLLTSAPALCRVRRRRVTFSNTCPRSEVPVPWTQHCTFARFISTRSHHVGSMHVASVG